MVQMLLLIPSFGTMDNIQTEIILITGRFHQPVVKAGICVNSILENQWIVHWFSQNPLPICTQALLSYLHVVIGGIAIDTPRRFFWAVVLWELC